jgi:hypothetical protein
VQRIQEDLRPYVIFSARGAAPTIVQVQSFFSVTFQIFRDDKDPYLSDSEFFPPRPLEGKGLDAVA